MKFLIVCQATGKCRPLATRLIQSLERLFLPGMQKDYFICSEKPFLPGGYKTQPIPKLTDPDSSFFRYEMFLAAEDQIKSGNYDLIFHIDADIEAISETHWEEIALMDHQDAILMRHPTIQTPINLWLPPESKWRIEYCQACFFGCRPKAFIEMSRTLSEAVREEQNMHFRLKRIADEGYFNSYWSKRADKVKVVPCSFGYPPDVSDWLRWDGWAGRDIHYSAIKKEEIRLLHHNVGSKDLPKPYEVFEKYPWSNKIPEWVMDERHIYWLYEVLTTSHHKTALEIGPLCGATSSAFVEALNRDGSLKHVTFVDTMIRDELKQTVAQCKYPDRVKLLQANSLDVLKQGTWDFILFDGDHSLEHVTKEVDELLNLRPCTVMAHDTGLETERGPEYLKHVMQVLPEYYCLEDNMRRANERTERGMFLATKSINAHKEFKESLAYWSSR